VRSRVVAATAITITMTAIIAIILEMALLLIILPSLYSGEIYKSFALPTGFVNFRFIWGFSPLFMVLIWLKLSSLLGRELHLL